MSNKSNNSEIAQKAFQRILDEDLNPSPEIYELFFAYYSGHNPDIVRSIDILVAQNFDLTNERCMELHKRHLKNDRTQETLDKAEQIVGSTLFGVDEIMTSFKDVNKGFKGSIEHINADILNMADTQEFKTILTSVVTETRKMVSENIHLERQLEQSSATMQELKKELEFIRQEAFTDTLTGIPNRKKFELEVVRLVAEARDAEEPVCVIFIDIDHFKSFNDTYGHQIGDQVLRLVAKAFKESLKGQDFFCRYGGEEFVILLPKTPLQGGYKIANILRESIENRDIKNLVTHEILTSVTISAGVSELKDGETVEEWIDRADRALYDAKRTGRNRVIVSQ
jgi:diguanylate cyclase